MIWALSMGSRWLWSCSMIHVFSEVGTPSAPSLIKGGTPSVPSSLIEHWKIFVKLALTTNWKTLQGWNEMSRSTFKQIFAKLIVL